MKRKQCSTCGAEFDCMNSPGEKCWCAHLPNVIPVSTEVDCLCPKCLKEKIDTLETKQESGKKDASLKL